MKSILWTVLFLFGVLWNSAARAASPGFDVGIVVSQYSAEVEAALPVTLTLPDGRQRTLAAGRYFFAADGGKIRLGAEVYEGPLVLTVAGEKGAGDTGNAGKGNPATRAREPLPSFLVNKQDCPGEVRIYASGEGADLTVVNRVSLEFYVESVLGPKSSPVWPDEAIKAQAVAVRSLA